MAVDENEQLWKDMVTNFPANEGRFAVFDLRQNMSDGRLAEKIVMITWYVCCFFFSACGLEEICPYISFFRFVRAPSTASVRNRMIVASSQDALKSKLDAAGLPVHQVNDIDELDHKDVIAKFIRA